MLTNMAPAKNLGDFERVFRCVDKDGDGKISAVELQLLIGTIGEELSLEEAEDVVRSADKDFDGLLDLNEFVELVNRECSEEEEEDSEKELWGAFRMYEMDGEGCITALSLKRTLSRLGLSRDMEECRAMIFEFDRNGDGVLSFEEFRVMML